MNTASSCSQPNESQATLAVIIPTYNRAHLVEQALDSVLKQTRPADQIIVMDDGSSDDTRAVVTNYGDRITYLQQENAGKAAATNAALTTASADYILLLDDDDVLLPDALERHLHHLLEDPSAGFTYSGCYLFDGDVAPDTPDTRRLYDVIDASPEEFFIRCLETFPFHTQGMLVARTSYMAVGPYDESLAFGQDYEMILRLARQYPGIRMPEPTFMLRVHGGDRGPSHARESADSREEGWRIYERKTFLEMRSRLPLEEYLPPTSDRTLQGASNRQAHLQRACIMARHGLFQEALEDLQAGLAASPSSSISSSEHLICSRMLDIQPALLRTNKVWLKQLRHLLLQHSPLLLDSCVAGLNWSFQREIKCRSYGEALAIASALLQLSGRRLPRLAARKSSQFLSPYWR